MRRGLLLALAAGWVLLTLGWMQRKLVGRIDASGTFTGGWPDRLKLARAPDDVRAAILTGDEALAKFLAAAKVNLGGAKKVFVLAHDPSRNDLFQWYRCAFELFPTRIWYAPGPELPAGRREIRLAVGPDFAKVMADHGIDRIAYFHQPDPERSRWFRAAVTAKPELVLTPLASPEPAPDRARPSRAGWWLGWLLLLPLGFALTSATGLDRAFRDRPAARIALGWLLGVGGTAWLMQGLSWLGVRWSLPAILGAWTPILMLGGFRAWLRRQAPAAADAPVIPAPPQAGSAPPSVRPLGVALVSIAGLIAVVEAHLPVGAWGNWDAWAIWGLKAKACWEAMGIPFGYLREPQYTFAHPDYPNGLPAVQCFLGIIAGGLDEGLLRLVPLGHVLAFLALLPVVLRDLGAGPWSLPLAGAIALAPAFLEYGTLGYGDVPVAVWGVAGLAVLVRVRRGLAPAWTVGLMGGLAALLKDEGLLWGAGGVLVLAVWTRRGEVRRGELACATAALVALVLPWRVALVVLGIGPNDFSIQPMAMLAAAPERIPFTLAHYARLMWWPDAAAATGGTWGFSWHAVVGLAASGASRLARPPYRDLLLVPATAAAGVLMVYLASRHPVAYHVESTAERVLVQLWPAVAAVSAAAAFTARVPARRTAARRQYA